MNGAAIKPASIAKIKSGLFALANSETAAAVNETPAQKLIRKYGRLYVAEHSGVGVGALGGIAIGATPQSATLAKLAPLIQKMQDDALLAKSEPELRGAEKQRFRELQIERRKQELAGQKAARQTAKQKQPVAVASTLRPLETAAQLRARITRVGPSAVLAEIEGEQRSEQVRSAVYDFIAGNPLRHGDVIVPAIEAVEARVRGIASHGSTRGFRVVRIVRAGNLRNVEVASITG
jgi:hypothetical protein